MTGRLVSLIALPLSLIGHLLFWMGSSRLLVGSRVLAPAEAGDVVAVSAGILLIAAAVATVALGSLGVAVIGSLQLAFSLLLFLVPFGASGGFSPAFEIMNAVRSASVDVGNGFSFYVPAGFAFVTGTIMLVAGLVARPRARARGRAAPIELRVGAALVGLLAVIGVFMAVAGGARLSTRLLVTFAGLDPVGLVALLVGSVLVGAAVLLGRWTSTASLVAGAVTTIAGLVGLASPGVLFIASADWPELRRGLEIAGPSGALLLIGVLLVVVGFALRVRARNEADGEPPPPTTVPSV